MKRRILNPYLLTAILVGAALLFVPGFASAGGSIGSFFATAIATVLQIFIWLLGKVLVIIIYLVVWVAQYNEFVTSPAVSVGWGVVRDICNMFFIVFLLIIAFSTILNLKAFELKHNLPKLLLMAVLINFSKLICGVIIDVAQVFMLTFVNGFKDIAGGNFGSMLGISTLLNVNANSPDVSLLGVAGTYILAIGYILVSLVVITIILSILVVRMVMIWIYVVLSPAAFLMGGTEKTSKYFGDWFKQFVNHVIAGPVLAFFIWMSFATMQSTTRPLGETQPPNQGNDADYYNSFQSSATQSAGGVTAGLADAGTPDGMLKFVVAIGMLIGGVMITKEISSQAGNIAGKVTDKSKKLGAMIGKNSGRAVANTALRTSGAVTKSAGDKLSKWTGGRYGDSMQKTGKFMHSWGTDIKKTREKEKNDKRTKTLKALGMGKESMKDLNAASKTALGRSAKGLMVAGVGAAMVNPFVVAAGLTHATFAANKGHIADGIKGVARRTQTGKTKRKANAELQRYEKGMSQNFKDKEKKQNNFKQSEMDDKKALKAKKDQESFGQPQAELDKINKKYAKEYASITDRYKKLSEKAEQDYQSGTSSKDLKNDAIIKPKLDAARKASATADEQHSIGRNTRAAIQNRNKMKEDKLKAADQTRDDMIQHANENLSGTARKVAIEDAHTAHKADTEKINTEHAEDIQKAKEYKKKVQDETPVTNFVGRNVNKVGDALHKYESQKRNIGATAQGIKDHKKAHEIIHEIGTESAFKRFDADTWSTGNGINNQQEEMYKEMSSGSEHGSHAAHQLAEWVEEISNNGEGAKPEHKKKLESLKKGIAYYVHANPLALNDPHFEHLEHALDEVDTGDKKRRKVHDFGPGHHAEGGHKEGHDKGDHDKGDHDKGGHAKDGHDAHDTHGAKKPH